MPEKAIKRRDAQRGTPVSELLLARLVALDLGSS